MSTQTALESICIMQCNDRLKVNYQKERAAFIPLGMTEKSSDEVMLGMRSSVSQDKFKLSKRVSLL